jgi:flagellar hook-associated protein 3 FlgL
MRVTGQMIAQTALRNINANISRLDKLQNQITSGKRVTKPSDDPIAVAQSLNYRTALSETSQYRTNIDEATGWLGSTDSALGGAIDLLQRARELAVQGASDTLSSQQRDAIRLEVDQLVQQTVQVGNSAYGSRYIFGGQKTDKPPYSISATGVVTYAGDDGAITRQIGTAAQTVVNVPGSSVFPSVFSALDALTTGLKNNDSSAISASLTTLDIAIDSVLGSRSSVGAKVNTLESAASRASDVEVNQTGMLSKVEDVDMAEALMNFATQETVYKASLQAGAKAVEPSLLDYLR